MCKAGINALLKLVACCVALGTCVGAQRGGYTDTCTDANGCRICVLPAMLKCMHGLPFSLRQAAWIQMRLGAALGAMAILTDLDSMYMHSEHLWPAGAVQFAGWSMWWFVVLLQPSAVGFRRPGFRGLAVMSTLRQVQRLCWPDGAVANSSIDDCSVLLPTPKLLQHSPFVLAHPTSDE